MGKGEMFVASDMPAILEHTRKVVFLESHQMAVVKREGLTLQTLEGMPLNYEVHSVAWDPISTEKGEYRHFMHKEIREQVRSLTDTIAGRVDFETGRIRLPRNHP
jgi:glucosamine--fructose-6-phosphate aminotransferase (isomerizing)